MSKIDIEAAFIYSKRADIRDVIRQSLKNQGIDTNNIHNVMDEKEVMSAIDKSEYAYLILDWEVGAESVQNVLQHNRKAHSIESHPVFLIAAKENEAILQAAKEYFVSACTIGEINTDTIREQIKGLVGEYRRLSPIRQVLLKVEKSRREGELDKAHEMLEKVLAHSPDNPRAIVELAESHISRNDWEAAENILRPHLAMDPPYARIKHLYARCRLKQNDYNGAIASLKGAQLISPYNTERLLEMGDLFLELDRVDEATDSFEEILKFAPEAKSAKLGKSKGMLLAGEINEALGLLRECASNRELSSVFNTAAIIAIKQEKFAVGFGLYKKALQLLARDKGLSARILYNMGIGFMKRGENEKGYSCFVKSNEMDPEFENAKHNVKVLSQTKSGSVAISMEEFEAVEFEETMTVGEDGTIAEYASDEAPGSDYTEDSGDNDDNLDLDAIFDDVENF
ncbi:tetratricopeptide repeat protein [Pseudobacteriovorax antillogorgiicola]|uniref:Tetratricopeptide repeat-containing protein n=1 Tax=Pseudobacteriovorax antillogorgiicola TaxID=1513793 RepID=A0A1Y6BIQ9_9BACT|nr:tetratricopeptide repeat protein [Pseudobacteriovorax antillogorgiicola]TCS55358.1 tetratricopeptide repeat protein [Pseudobacteriovorax antillogorgiicola]SMF13575.1 Tetratricopeptide repeat-containing protein [Pseudobacteriovorax antillogorgiicola]